jgi:thiosulfate dehydrogenase [quinone] large subunit
MVAPARPEHGDADNRAIRPTKEKAAMTTTQLHPRIDVLVEHDVVTHSTARRALAVLRVAFGFTFLWAFVDKLFALGFHTGVNADGVTDRFGPAAWINGGSPTTGFLKFGVPENNPFKGFFNGMAGQAWADWLFMAGLLSIGVALTFGIGMRIAAAAGALLYTLMWAASLPLENNPVIDDHLIGAISVVALAALLAGDTWGLGQKWARTGMVRRHRTLR